LLPRSADIIGKQKKTKCERTISRNRNKVVDEFRNIDKKMVTVIPLRRSLFKIYTWRWQSTKRASKNQKLVEFLWLNRRRSLAVTFTIVNGTAA